MLLAKWANIINVSEKNNSGQLVKNYIEETKEAFKEEARSIKRQDYIK